VRGGIEGYATGIVVAFDPYVCRQAGAANIISEASCAFQAIVEDCAVRWGVGTVEHIDDSHGHCDELLGGSVVPLAAAQQLFDCRRAVQPRQLTIPPDRDATVTAGISEQAVFDNDHQYYFRAHRIGRNGWQVRLD
jgi:hypothetical protein